MSLFTTCLMEFTIFFKMSRKITLNTFCFLNLSCCSFVKLFFCICIELNNDGDLKNLS